MLTRTAINVNTRLTDREVHQKLLEIQQDGKAHITLAELAEQVGFAPRTVSYSLDRLESCGKVKRLRGRGRGGMIYGVQK